MITVNEYCRERFGEKLYKISLDGGFTCPTRDGTLDTRGCIFCSGGGSGEFSESIGTDAESMNIDMESLDAQIEAAKECVKGKFRGQRYIAYFQAFTGTYAPAGRLRALYEPVIRRGDIAALSIATRPDCLQEEILAVIEELNRIKPVWVELGLQTIHEKSIRYIRRCYANEVYREAVEKLNRIGVHVITHVILGLPGETKEDMAETVRYAARCGSGGIKLQLLHVLSGTDLEKEYRAGRVPVMDLPVYIETLKVCIRAMPEDMVLHRLTGDAPKRLLVAPLWSADKKRVLNAIRKEIFENQ